MTPISLADLVIDASTGLIAVVLLISGTAKLTTPDATLRGMAALGVPSPLRRRWIAVAFPVVELLTGLALLVAPGIWRLTAALVALAMMLGFTALVTRALRAGGDVSCECFGSLSRDAVDGWTLGRNILFVVASVAATLAGPGSESLVAELVAASATQLAFLATIWIALALVALLLRWALGLRDRLRAVERAAGENDGGAERPRVELEMGDPIPAAELVNASGATLKLNRLARGRAVFLVFIKAGCGACLPVAERLAEWEARIGGTVVFRVATSSRPDEIADRYPQLVDHVRYGALGASRALGVDGIPAAIVLGNNGVIASPLARGLDEIEALVNGVDDAQRQNAGG